MRRRAINGFFSRTAIKSNQSLIYRNIDILCDNLARHVGSQDYTLIVNEFVAMAADTVSCYEFGEPLGLLGDEKLAKGWLDITKAIGRLSPISKQFPWIMPLALNIPMSIIRLFGENVTRVMGLRHVSSTLLFSTSISPVAHYQ
jgi:hypothetical protein